MDGQDYQNSTHFSQLKVRIVCPVNSMRLENNLGSHPFALKKFLKYAIRFSKPTNIINQDFLFSVVAEPSHIISSVPSNYKNADLMMIISIITNLEL